MPPVLDVRDFAAFLQGHSPESVSIPLTELAARMYELPEKGAALSVFHDDPQQLQIAVEFLTGRGYRASAIAGLSFAATGPSRQRLWSPSPLLDEALSFTAKPGRALDLACGSGREAVHLASLGWQVDAVDLLPDALQNASALAKRNGVEIRTIERDLRKQGLPPTGPYDLVILFRFWHQPLIRTIPSALAPGGVLAVEAFHPRDALSRRSVNLISADELAHEARGLHVRVCRVLERNGRTFSQLIAIKD